MCQLSAPAGRGINSHKWNNDFLGIPARFGQEQRPFNVPGPELGLQNEDCCFNLLAHVRQRLGLLQSTHSPAFIVAPDGLKFEPHIYQLNARSGGYAATVRFAPHKLDNLESVDVDTFVFLHFDLCGYHLEIPGMHESFELGVE